MFWQRQLRKIIGIYIFTEIFSHILERPMKNKALIGILLLAVILLAGWVWQIPKKIQTNKLEIVDSKGRVRIIATVDSLDNPVILTLDSTGRVKGQYK